MRANFIWIFLIGLTTLLVELLLVRVFDVIMSVNTSYAIVTCAIFGMGLAGIFLTLRPFPGAAATAPSLLRIGLLLAGICAVFLPALNALPFEADEIAAQPGVQLGAFLVMYLVLLAPFFLAGMGITVLFTAFPERAGALYFWNLAGAAAGCLLLPLLLPRAGPGGVLLVAAGLCLAASSPFLRRAAGRRLALAAGLAVLVAASAGAFGRLDFRSHSLKRGARESALRTHPEFKRWDPISKIVVVDLLQTDPATGRPLPGTNRKLISYDGGAQSSHIYAFDGDLAALRRNLPRRVLDHFWQRGVLASHYLKRDTGDQVLVIGCAGGQEVTGALMYGAGRIDAVDLVGTVVDLGRVRYAGYNGGIFLDPRVHFRRGEGRAWLHRTGKRYDVIQIFSYHNSARIASGAMAIQAFYLQTAEAYQEYFEHLTDNGVLQLSQAFPARVVSTAALAWRRMGRRDFQRHVVIYMRDGFEDHPTILIKMSPWTAAEIADLDDFFSRPFAESPWSYSRVEDPLDPSRSFLSPAFYSGKLPPELTRAVPYRVDPVTDDRPFYHFVRKTTGAVAVDSTRFVDATTARLLNQQRLPGLPIPRDLVQLYLTGAVCLFYAALSLFLPLRFSSAGRARWQERPAALTYFGLLGAGFILIELVLIQIGMKLIGYPIYAFSTVIFVLLVAAGLGSLSTQRREPGGGWRGLAPFAGILAAGGLFWLVHPAIVEAALGASLSVRILVLAALIFPFGFFLGMPFPLGVRAMRGAPRGAIAWAWGMNSLFTVAGGFGSVLLSLFLGFRMTLLVALLLYAGASWAYAGMRGAGTASGEAAEAEGLGRSGREPRAVRGATG